jgi:hypothetical protein
VYIHLPKALPYLSNRMASSAGALADGGEVERRRHLLPPDREDEARKAAAEIVTELRASLAGK